MILAGCSGALAQAAEEQPGEHKVLVREVGRLNAACGALAWAVNFRLSGPSAEGGFILQRVRITNRMSPCNFKDKGEIECGPTPKQFIEVWTVDAGKSVPNERGNLRNFKGTVITSYSDLFTIAYSHGFPQCKGNYDITGALMYVPKSAFKGGELPDDFKSGNVIEARSLPAAELNAENQNEILKLVKWDNNKTTEHTALFTKQKGRPARTECNCCDEDFDKWVHGERELIPAPGKQYDPALDKEDPHPPVEEPYEEIQEQKVKKDAGETEKDSKEKLIEKDRKPTPLRKINPKRKQ